MVHTKTDKFIGLEQKYAANTYKPIDVVIERGEGAWVVDVDGKRYLDCLSACLLYTSPSPRDGLLSRMPSSA